MKFIVAIIAVILIVLGAILFLRRNNSAPEAPVSVNVTQNPFSTSLPANISTTNPTSVTPASTTLNLILNTEQSPDKFTTNFYTWYISYISDDPSILLSEEFSSNILKWITKDFASRRESIIVSTDADPFLLVPSVNKAMLINLQSKISSQSTSSSTVNVTLQPQTPYSTALILNVHLIYENGMWKISDVTGN